MNSNKLNVIAAAAFLALATGCDCYKTQGPDGNACFFPEDQKYVIHRVGAQQASSAARADATLYPIHFHGGKLNSLGEQKLKLMLGDDDESRPLPVFLDLGEDEHLEVRREAVLTYLQKFGLTTDMVKLEAGPNPSGGTPVAPLPEEHGQDRQHERSRRRIRRFKLKAQVFRRENSAQTREPPRHAGFCVSRQPARCREHDRKSGGKNSLAPYARFAKNLHVRWHQKRLSVLARQAGAADSAFR